MEILDEGFSHKNELTEEEKKRARFLQTDARFAFKDMKNGRIALFVTSGLFVLGIAFSLMYSVIMPIFLIIGEGLFFFTVIFLAALFMPKKPVVALSTGIGFYLLHQFLSAIGDPAILIKGILFKIVLIYFLVKGIIGAKKYAKAKEELQKLGEEIPPEFRFK